MHITPIAYFHSPFSSKFGVPRQSGVAPGVEGRIVFTEQFANPDALRGLDQFDRLWIIWAFSQNVDAEKHALVRPPRLGGNEHMGVWATRSSFRPNNLALSCVKIKEIIAEPKRCEIVVLGADLMNGTPIYDIKPYLPSTDAHPDASGGFTDTTPWKPLEVQFDAPIPHDLTAAQIEALTQVLAQDPRPHYHNDPTREYGMPFYHYDIKFRVPSPTTLLVTAFARLP